LAQKGSVAGDKVEEWRRTVVSKYAGDWQLEFYTRNFSEHKKTQEKLLAQENERHFKLIISALERD